MTGKIHFKMRSEPARPRETPAAGAPAPRSGSGSFDDEALAALEAALGTLEQALDPAPKAAPKPDPTPAKPTLADLLDHLEASLAAAPAPERVQATPVPQPALRTARELIAAMDSGPIPGIIPAPLSTPDAIHPPMVAEPSPRMDLERAPTTPKELRNGDLPVRPGESADPARARRTPAPPLEPPDFELSSAKPRRFRWPFSR